MVTKHIYRIVLAIIALAFVDVSAYALSGGEIARLNREAWIKLRIRNAEQAAEIANFMIDAADLKAHDASTPNTAFYVHEKTYWTRIKNDAQTFADTQYDNYFYFADRDYWAAMIAKYTQAAAEFPEEKNYWADALEQIDKMLEAAPESDNSLAPIKGEAQEEIDRDTADFDRRYSTLIKKEERRFGIGTVEIIIIIFILGLGASLIALVVYLANRKKKTPTPPPYYPTKQDNLKL